jgi:hypothetical protein
MALPGYQLERCLLDEIVIRLHGDLDETTLLACERDARAQLSLAKPGSLRVLWNVLDVTGYTIEARAVLARLQIFLADKAERTVYAAERAEPRSLALWAVHMAGAWQARIAQDVERAQAWLRGDDELDTGVRPLASTRPPAVKPCDKAAS